MNNSSLRSGHNNGSTVLLWHHLLALKSLQIVPLGELNSGLVAILCHISAIV